MRHRTSFLSLFASVLMLLGSSVAVGAAHAAQHDYVIDTTADAGDVDPGDGVCDDGDGTCTLRAAIMEANALPGAHAISLPAGTYTLTIPGIGEDAAATGDLDITDDLTIDGAGADSSIIDANGIDRVFQVLPGATARFDGVTVRDGFPPTQVQGGGFWNEGTLTLTDSIVTGNRGAHGGGIYNRNGTLEISGSTIGDNRARFFAGGIYNHGRDAVLTVTDSTVSDNVTRFRGGGIYNLAANATLTNTTVSGNTGHSGGGIMNHHGASTLTLINSTVSGNTARQPPGSGSSFAGGINNHSGTVVLENSTVSDNVDADGPAGGIGIRSGTVRLQGTIVANSSPADCSGAITTLGHNLASDNSCGLSGSGDLNNTNPLLGPLADDGGPTETHPLLSGSPAIDAVPLGSCAVSTDQRGVARPQGSACDIGAYELVAELTVDIVIKPGNGPNSVNPRSRGNIPAAILSTADFDAANEVDREVLTFGASGDEDSLHLRGGRNAAPNCGVEDVNGDSLDDLVCQFQTQETGFEHGDTEGVLKGQTVDGMAIIGTDSVTMVGRP